MVWRHEKARQRIKKLISEAPEIEVGRFADEYMPLYEARRAELDAKKERISPPLFDLSKGNAVLVETVQIYIGITNYDEYRIDEEQETVASHERALRFLHLYYSICDRVVEQSKAQRVDFHGSRMHAVVLDRAGAGVTQENIAEAFAFIRDFQAVAKQANRELANSEFTAHFRIGVDVGPCVAINNGTGLEQEPMFLGSSANHAAKLAEGDEPGVYLSDRVRALLNLPEIGAFEGAQSLSEGIFSQVLARSDQGALMRLGSPEHSQSPEELIGSWKDEIKTKKFPDPTIPRFAFHHKEPPLSQIKYAELAPSNSIRMPLISIFADLSGFTAFIDNAIRSDKIADAVRALYVIREEFQNVVEDDFDGRKVRLIGDCIHALLAKGSSTETNELHSVRQSFLCAGGLRSSFEICQDEMANLTSLGLSIGIEYGQTPISRIGIRGERSVRIASSVATATSEKMQKECRENEIKFGPNAMEIMPTELNDLTDDNGVAPTVMYDDVSTSLSNEPIASPMYARVQAPAASTIPRAHFKKI